MATVAPALKGDGHGHYRILIVGNCGTGKTTLLRKLSTLLEVPALPLDKVRFKPNWKPVPKPEYREIVSHFIASNQEWVIDGNSSSTVGDLTHSGATDIVWLDPPALLYWPRLIRRTFWRLLRLNPAGELPDGCYETIGNVFFDSDSILWCMIEGHWRLRKRYKRSLEDDSVDNGGKIKRIGGWGRQFRVWWAGVEELAKGRSESTSAQ